MLHFLLSRLLTYLLTYLFIYLLTRFYNNAIFFRYINMTNQDIIDRLERIESLLLRLTAKKENTAPFLPFMEQAVEEAAVSEGTRENHRNTLRHLRDFRPAMTFADLSPRLVADFEGYLNDLGLKLNTVAKQMKVFRRYVNVAIDEELLTSDPFRKWHVRTEPTSKQALTERQLRKWEQLLSDSTLSDEELLVSRAFLFSCYTGLRYSDVREAHFNHIHTVNRQKWLIIRMHKTKTVVRIPLTRMFSGKALDLITTRGLLFPSLPVNSRCNTILRRLAKRLHIRKHLSFHVGRVTCATILIHRGVPVTTIQQILGHRSLVTTQGYAHVLDNTIYKDVGRAFR